MIELTCRVNRFFDLWQRCNFSGLEALEFLCIYTRVLPATADVFPVVANTRTKSIQKQIKTKYPDPQEYSTSIQQEVKNL